MTEVRVGDQTIRYDRAATAAVYASVARGGAEDCGCIFCQNFVAHREAVYPASFRNLLEQLGVDSNKEDEVFEYGPVEDGCHVYGGRFSLVGEMVAWGEQNCRPPDSHEFEFFFTTSGLRASAFRGGPQLAIEFTAHAKWVLSEGTPLPLEPA